MDRHDLGRRLFEEIPDPSTASLLLPAGFVARDNSRRLRHMKIALRQAMDRCLSPAQKEQMELYYKHNMRKTQIAARQKVTCSAVSKSMKAGESSMRDYIEMYMGVFTALEQEFLREEGS